MTEKMGCDEFSKWLLFYKQKDDANGPKGKNLMDGGEEAILRGFGF